MSRTELIEWIVMLVIVVAWWPHIFLNYDPLWYHVLIYYVSPVVLIVIFVNRYKNMQAGFEHSEDMIEEQQGGPEEGAQPQPQADAESGTEEKAEPRAEQARASLPWTREPGESDDEN